MKFNKYASLIRRFRRGAISREKFIRLWKEEQESQRRLENGRE